MTAGRKPLKAEKAIDLEKTHDQAQIETAMTVMQSDVQRDQQDAMTGVFALGRMVGAAQMAESISVISATAKVRAFGEVNKSKSFKHLPIKHPNGEFRPAENIDEFSRVVFGKGYKAMSDEKVMLERLGEDLYENANRLGLHRAQLRLLINLPEDTRSAIDEAMAGGSKSEVVTLIQSLANQLDEAKAKTEELKFEVAAKEDVLSTRSAQINSLEEKLARVKTLPADEVRAELQREATAHLNDTRGALIGKFSAAIAALYEHAETTGAEQDVAYVAGLVGQIQSDLTALRDRYGIPDIAPALIPEWVNDPAFGANAE